MLNNINIESVIQENQRRNTELHTPYDPYTGYGSPIDRFPMFIDKDQTECIYLPKSLNSDPFIVDVLSRGSISQALESYNLQNNEEEIIINEFSELRYKHDFEFWAVMTVLIKDKISGKNIPFKLNRGQRRLLAKLEEMRINNKPIRIILLKARQWGGSTLTQIYAAWLQNIHKSDTKWNSVIIADVEGQTRNIRSMYKNMAKHYPAIHGTITFAPFEGSNKNYQIIETESVVSIGSMQRPDSLRSDDIKIAHFSEVGLWKETAGKKPEDLVQAIKSSIPFIPDTLIVEESTAKGVGNYFHRAYQAAESGKSGYAPVFVAWFDIERNQMPIDNYTSFIKRMNDYDWFLWKSGATLEGIRWYNNYLNTEYLGDHWRMKSENPTNAAEAFQSTGRRAFAPNYVLQSRENNEEPLYIGEIYADSVKGPEALKNIYFDKYNNGSLYVWSEPDKTINISNRYAVFTDIGGRNPEADWSVIKVFDRYWMMEGGKPEVVATWRGHLDQDLIAWKAAQIAAWYNNALLAVETNSLRKEQSEGDHFFTILNEIAPYYDNLYARIDPDKVREGAPIKYGFHTNKSTKPMIIDELNAALRDDLYIERDKRACDEMDYYEIKPDGSYGAVEGQHDDILMCTAGGVWLCLSYMDAPKQVVTNYNPNKGRRIVSEASI